MRPSTLHPPAWAESSQEPERRRTLKSGLRSTARSSRSRSRSQASARQLREAKRGGSAGGGVSSMVNRPGMATSSAGARSGSRLVVAGSGAGIKRAEDSTSANAASDVRLASVSATECCATISSAEPACTRIVSVLAMNSSTSLCRQVCPHRCFMPGRCRLRELHPLRRSSPPCSEATNQWFVCFFSVAQMSHDMACRITAFPPFRTVFPRISMVAHVLSRPGRRPGSIAAGRAGNPNGNLLGIAFLHFIAHSWGWVSCGWKESEDGSKLNWEGEPRSELGRAGSSGGKKTEPALADERINPMAVKVLRRDGEEQRQPQVLRLRSPRRPPPRMTGRKGHGPGTKQAVKDLRPIAEARSSLSWRGPGSAGRCNRDKCFETTRRT